MSELFKKSVKGKSLFFTGIVVVAAFGLIGFSYWWQSVPRVHYIGPSIDDSYVSSYNFGKKPTDSIPGIRVGNNDWYQIVLSKKTNIYTKKEIEEKLLREIKSGFYRYNFPKIIVSMVYKGKVYELEMTKKEFENVLSKNNKKFTYSKDEFEKLVTNNEKRKEIFKKYGRIY